MPAVIARATVDESPETMLPSESTTLTTGWVGSATVLDEELGCVAMTKWSAAPDTSKVALMALVSAPSVAVKV